MGNHNLIGYTRDNIYCQCVSIQNLPRTPEKLDAMKFSGYH